MGLYKSDKLVDTTTCNVGTAILAPSRSATFSGYIYSTTRPAFDRMEAQVVKFQKME